MKQKKLHFTRPSKSIVTKAGKNKIPNAQNLERSKSRMLKTPEKKLDELLFQELTTKISAPNSNFEVCIMAFLVNIAIHVITYNSDP